MSIGTLETEVFDLEEVRVVIRTSSLVGGPDLRYRFERKLGDEKTVDNLKTRIRSMLEGFDIRSDVEIVVIRGDGAISSNNSMLGCIRNSYAAKH